MKKAFIFGALGMLLVVGIIFMYAGYGNAGLTDTKTSITVAKGDNLTIGTKEVVYNTIWETYKPIEIKSVTDEVLFKAAIVEHTAQCGSDCYSLIEIYLPEDGVLIDDLYINDKDGNRLSIKPNVEISNAIKEVEAQDYKQECTVTSTLKNGTNLYSCKNVLAGSHLVKEQIYEEYILGSSVKAGNYLIRPSAQFELNGWESNIYDWIIVTKGKTLNEWATWNSSLEASLVSYWKLDNDQLDAYGTNEGNLIAGTPNQAGLINKSHNFAGGTSGVNFSSNTWGYNKDSSYNTWVNWNTVANDRYLWHLGGNTGTGALMSICDLQGSNYRIALLEDGIAWREAVQSSVTASAGQWDMITMTYVGATKNMSMYINGAYIGSATYSSSAGSGTRNRIADGLYAGASQGLSPDAKIDDTSLFSKPLTAAEVSNLYQIGLSGNGYDYTVTTPCLFNGSVKNSAGVGISGARVVISNAESDSFKANVTTDANGLWNYSINANGNYTVWAYQPTNKTRGGDIKTYVECIQT